LEYKGKGSRFRPSGALLSMTALATIWSAGPAAANCDVTSSPNTVSCTADTVTVHNTNTDAATPSSNDDTQEFTTGGNVTGQIASGVTVSGYGLVINTSEDGSGINFTNNGAVNQTSNVVFGGLSLLTSTGAITYNSASGATIDGTGIASLMLFSQSTSATGDLTAHVNGDITNTGSIGAGTGVALQSYGPVNILLDGTGNISGRTGVSVNTLNANSGASNITIGGSGNIVITGTSGDGIDIEQGANAGTVTVNRTGSITGVGSGAANKTGINVRTYGSGGVFITGVGAISNVGYGIFVSGSTDFTIAPGASINALTSGIYTLQLGDGTANITSGFDITAAQGSGITASSGGSGDQTVTVTGGTVSGYSTAVALYGNGSGNLIFNMSGGTLLTSTNFGSGALNLDQQGTGNATVHQTGGSIGLAATPIVGTGILVHTSAGTIDVTTADVYATQTAIRTASGGNGSVTIATNGVVNSASGSAIISTANAGTTTVTNHGSLYGAGPDAVVNVSSNGTISIDNAAGAVITSTLAAPDTRSAIIATSGTQPVTITNSGTIYGLISLGNGSNTITNDGTWTTTGINYFGGGSTTLSNTGILNAGNGTEFNSDTLAFTSTGTFVPTGTVTVNGSLSLGGIYQVNLASGGADKTVVYGTATLTGGIVRAVQLGGGFVVGQSFVILTATGGLSGTFSGLNLSGSIAAHLDYDANNALITVDRVALAGALPNGTINQRNVAGGIDAAMNGGAASGNFTPIFSLSGAALASALDSLSGEVATGAATTAFQSMNGFVSLLTNTGHSAFGGPAANGGAIGYADESRVPPAFASAYAAVSPARAARESQSALDRRWGVWGGSYGSAGKVNGEGAVLGSHDVTPRTYGVVAGADYRASADTVLGFALGGGGTNWGLSNGLGSGRSDVFQIGAYGTHKAGAAYLSGALAYAWNDISTNRTVNLASIDQLNARVNGQTFAGRIEAGYRVATQFVGITPYAALQAQSFSTPAYSEVSASGNGAFALAYASRSTASLRTELGSRFDKTVAIGADATLSLRSQLAWVHDTNTERAMGAVFQALPGSAFTVCGAAAPKDSALLSSGAELRFVNNVTLGARVSGELAGAARGVSAEGSLRYAW
jgi:outer membrane autotransporter protein